MKGIAKIASYIVVATLVVVFGFWYGHEHSLSSRPGTGVPNSRLIISLVLLILCSVVLGIACVVEIRKFVSGGAEKWILQGAASTGPVPELEEAERLRAAGRPLDAIGVIREYLQTNPYELQVMARIAEIYRYDLNNDLAAALEYEELLKHKLPDDQWAWAALHLAKLYGRRNELEKSVTLLERLDSKYPHTIAGRRAKKALEQMRSPGANPAESDEGEDEQA